MSLDFAVLDQSGGPERTVSLGVNLHHELVISASALELARFRDFADYYEDAEVAVDDLPSLAAQVQILRAQAGSTDLRSFLDELSELIAYAVANGKALYAIAD